MNPIRRSGESGASLLRYQLRFSGEREPESLIAVDVADALHQARQRAFVLQTPVALWRDGALVAECAIPRVSDPPRVDPGVREQLVSAGFYIYPPSSAT